MAAFKPFMTAPQRTLPVKDIVDDTKGSGYRPRVKANEE
jgi:hypothetical protein